MPADRRFETPEPKNDRTDLEVWMRVKGPDFLRQNAANIVLAIAVLIAAGFFLYTRQQNKRAESVGVQQNTAAAYDAAAQLRGLLMSPVTSDAVARERQQRARDAIGFADVVINSDAAAPAQRAIALLAKGDVYWALANAPAASLATSQPVSSFAVKPAEGYLGDAEAAYTEILRSYGDEPEPVGGALMSLAAIAENRGKFDDAAKWYQRAIDEKSLRPAYHDMAAARLAMLDELRKPVTLANAATQTAVATQPAFIPLRLPTPAADAATTAPASMPATQP